MMSQISINFKAFSFICEDFWTVTNTFLYIHSASNY